MKCLFINTHQNSLKKLFGEFWSFTMQLLLVALNLSCIAFHLFFMCICVLSSKPYYCIFFYLFWIKSLHRNYVLYTCHDPCHVSRKIFTSWADTYHHITMHWLCFLESEYSTKTKLYGVI